MSERGRVLDTKLKVHLDEGTVKNAEQTVEGVEAANLAMLSNIRQGVQIGIFAIGAMGTALNQTITLMVEAVFLTVEVALEIQIALAAGTSGLSLLSPGVLLKGGTVVSMILLIGQLQQKKAENARKTNNIVSALRMASFR